MKNNSYKDKKILLGDIRRAKADLEAANENFLYETDPVLVDMYTYQIKALEEKYRYLIKLAKSTDLHSDNIYL